MIIILNVEIYYQKQKYQWFCIYSVGTECLQCSGTRGPGAVTHLLLSQGGAERMYFGKSKCAWIAPWPGFGHRPGAWGGRGEWAVTGFTGPTCLRVPWTPRCSSLGMWGHGVYGMTWPTVLVKCSLCFCNIDQASRVLILI